MRSVEQEEEGRVKMFTMQNAGKEDDGEEANGMSINATRGSHVLYMCCMCRLYHVWGGIYSIIPSLN